MEEQVVSIWLGTSGQLDDVPVDDIRRFESEFLDHLRRNEEGSSTRSATPGSSPTTTSSASRRSAEFKKQFSRGRLLGGAKEEQAEALDEDEVDQETVKVNKPEPSEEVRR